ncbi:putative regulatory protein, FmdB family [Thioflavicoccus mobilis 8321]|uniref:Putative regulatory protein, FmdB family n=1 Tax=Thioflavicoccus mobilis 8321 TaxID=765912 RepID=L0GVD5_9GAMM|nr:zinc ribbon domain-containing protein [Thioflavicoccus mobilis]AGA89792.1 putative regulatory protein, FmdB family [Thioflavicoccus mobilis 8321]
MPVYEFYCPDCHTIFSFFSRRVDTETRPDCPRCGRHALGRRASLFAFSKGRGEAEDDGPGLPPGMDEERMMQALASMSDELGGIDENDPKESARLMKRLFDKTGLRIGDGMAEALRRMEAGEDPDQIEAELGDALEAEDPFAAGPPGKACSALPSPAALRRELLPPARDQNWYPLVPERRP